MPLMRLAVGGGHCGRVGFSAGFAEFSALFRSVPLGRFPICHIRPVQRAVHQYVLPIWRAGFYSHILGQSCDLGP